MSESKPPSYTTDGILNSLDYDKILSSDRCSAITKTLCRQLMKTPYMTLGDFFKNLSTTDVKLLSCEVELSKDDDDILSDLLIMSELLSRAEGCDPLTDQDTFDNVNYFCVLVTCESLARKGLVDIFHENMSFGNDLKNAEVVRRK